MMIKPNNYIVINMMSSGRLHIQIGMFIVTIKYGVRSAIVRPLAGTASCQITLVITIIIINYTTRLGNITNAPHFS